MVRFATMKRVRGRIVLLPMPSIRWTCPDCGVETVDSTGDDEAGVRAFWSTERRRVCVGCKQPVLVEAHRPD